MYKDKNKQREANRLASQRRRDRAKGMAQGMTNAGYDAQLAGCDAKGIAILNDPAKIAPMQPVSSGCRTCKLLSYEPGKGMSCPKGQHLTSIVNVFEANINPDCDCARDGDYD